jgi:hypothetical protein
MIVHLPPTGLDKPTMSLNELSEFPFASAKRKLRILHDQKFGNPFRQQYYQRATSGILRSLENGEFSQYALNRTLDEIASIEPRNRQQLVKLENNALAVHRFIEIGPAVNPPPGKHYRIHRNAKFILDHVIVSARPEIETHDLINSDFAFTKLRFSKSKVSADAQEIALLALLYYGQSERRDNLRFSIEKSKLIDCFSKTIVLGHKIGRHRYQQLHDALAEIYNLWPSIIYKHEAN